MSPIQPVRLNMSMGDPNGVGPELILRCVQKLADLSEVQLAVSGHTDTFRYYRHVLDLAEIEIQEIEAWDQAVAGAVNLIHSEKPFDGFSPEPGALQKEAGGLAMKAVISSLQSCLSGKSDAMVTAPFSKKAVNMAGYNIPGHTEYISEHSGGHEPAMMMVADDLRIGLVTAHISLKNVADAITTPLIRKKLTVIQKTLQGDFGIVEPQIAVLGLNPHAGDGGMMGREEFDVISPAIDAFNEEGGSAVGPLPADAFFGLRKDKQFDAVLCMYHDQGLAPFKALAFDRGVNFTGGLPVVRTSPVHGTAFDIAGKGKARLGSMLSAIDLAATVVRNRAKRTRGSDEKTTS